MATNWQDFYAECPFYRRTNGKTSVTCSGVTDASELTWKFKKAEDYAIQMRTFCCKKYRNCEVYQMLAKAKYEED